MKKYNIEDISLTSNVERISFCEVWPTAKKGLQLLQDMVKNPVAKSVIEIVIITGDTFCA